MSAKHTPGPWTSRKQPHGEHRVADERDARVATCSEEGDARLIAAAPDLLEACRVAHVGLENMTSEQFSHGADKSLREALAAAIAKAEGSTETRAAKKSDRCIYCDGPTRKGSVDLGEGQVAHAKCQAEQVKS